MGGKQQPHRRYTNDGHRWNNDREKQISLPNDLNARKSYEEKKTTAKFYSSSIAKSACRRRAVSSVKKIKNNNKNVCRRWLADPGGMTRKFQEFFNFRKNHNARLVKKKENESRKK